MKKLVLYILFFLLSSFAFSQNANWTAFKPAAFPTNVSGQIHGISRITQMKFHPTSSSKLYAVSARGGLFLSTDGGNNWTIASGCDNMPYSTFTSVCIDFTNDQILYLGAGDHNYYYSWGGATGVWKSTNGGQTFTQTTLNNKIIIEMVMDPNDHNIIVAATSGGVYKTTNAGSTWILKTANRQFDDLKQKTPTSRTLYAATTDSAFFRSTDFGDTWSQITSGIVLPAGITNGNGCRIAVTPADTNIVILGMVANANIIYKSTNGGTSFTGLKTGPSPYLGYYDNTASSHGQGDYNFGIGIDRLNANIVYLVAHNVWKSTDGGTNWTQLTNWWAECHTDMHQITTSPYNNNQLWDMNDGGVWLSTDAGANWAPKSDGIYGYEIYHGNCSPTRKDMMSIGTQDNGELYGNNSGWFTNRGGDWGSQCAFDYRSNSSMVYYYQNARRRLVTGSENGMGLPVSVTVLQDIAFHRSNSNLAFVGDTSIYRTTNLTNSTPTWTSIYNTNKKIMAMHASFADANKLYIITSDQTIYVSSNALSATPTFTSYALPNSTNNAANITTIKSAPNTVYITCNTKVYRSTDSGVNWTNITYNLPSVNHIQILADEYYSANEMVFIASNNVVYYKLANALSWTLYTTNLPSRTSLIDMSIFNDSTSNTSLRVATYGRGMWETPISNLRTINANFAAEDTSPCPGTAINFSDLSTGNIASRTWSFPGGTPSSSTVNNPMVTYSSSGSYNVTLTVSDGATTSSITKNNYINIQGSNLPLAEGFEGASDPPSGWKNNDNGTSGYLWEKTSDASGFGNSVYSMRFNNYSWNVPGEKDELVTPRLDFSGYNSITLTFDVAYQVYAGYVDSLNVLLATNCGTNFTNVYAKGGSGLTTAGSSTNLFTPTAAQWRTETVNLTSFSGQNDVSLEFQNVNGYGNNLFIDNINIQATVAASAGVDRTLCAGNSASIGMSPVSGVNYSWTPATGLSSSTVSNPTATPAATTTYILTATQANSGISKTDTAIVYISQNVVTSVSIAANPAGGICQGTNVTFTATPLNAGSPTYQWKLNGNNVGTNTATYSNSALNTSDQIICIVTGNAVCAVGSPATSNTISMTVTQSVTPSISITANPSNNICSGTSVTFTASALNGGTPPNYQWKKNGVNVGTNSTTYTDNALATGTQIVCVLNSNASCATTTQVTSNTITITVNPNTTASVSISANPGNVICQGTNVTFTAAPLNGGTPSYQWKKNGTNVGTNNVSYSDNSLVTSDVITCEMTGTANCSSGSPATSNSITMTVNPSVAANVSISANPAGGICAGTNVTFTATPVNGGTSTYQWKRNGVNAGTNSPTYSNSSLNNSDQISCVMTSNATCVTGSPATSNIITMSVTSNVASSISIIASPGGAICTGTNVTFTATPTNGGTPAYQWKENGLPVGTNSSSYSDNTLSNSDQLSCTMTSSITCVTGSPANSNTITMTVSPAVTPSVTIAANPSGPICQGTSVTFTATPVNGGSPSYQWKKNGVNVGTNSSTFTDNAFATGIQISCVISSNASCASPTSATSNSIVMSVNPNVTAGVTIATNQNSPICEGTTATFTASPMNGGSTPSYQWKNNGVNTGTNSPTYSDNSLTGSNLISCVMTSSAPCVSGSPATSNPVQMDITANVSPSVTIATNTNPVCDGSNATFTATPVNGGSSPSYQWKNGVSNVGTNSNTFSSNTLTDGNVITCEMISNESCITGNTTTSNAITENVTPLPQISGFSPASGFDGMSVVITGSDLIAVTSVLFNGIAAGYVVDSSSQITATVPNNASSGTITVIANCGIAISQSSFTVTAATPTINLRVFIEGYYLGNGTMAGDLSPTVSDTFTVELHSANSPHVLIASEKSLVNTSGYGSFTFPNNFAEENYYLVVKHRNSIETWSASPIFLSSGVNSYDFTTGANKAFGNNQKDLLDGRWALYSGDLSDANLGRGYQDGVIESQDYSDMESAVSLTLLGYVPEDLTGDNIVESSDYSLLETNIFFTVAVIRP